MKKILFPALLFSACISNVSCAASFDCAKASSATEKLICNNESISKLDEQLANSYKQALENATNKDALKKSQVEWLKQQRACKDTSCLTQSYQARIDELRHETATPAERIVSEVGTMTAMKDSYTSKVSTAQSAINSTGSKPSDDLVSAEASNSELLGSWTASTQAAIAIYGKMHIYTNKISWGGFNQYNPYCETTYKITKKYKDKTYPGYPFGQLANEIFTIYLLELQESECSKYQKYIQFALQDSIKGVAAVVVYNEEFQQTEWNLFAK